MNLEARIPPRPVRGRRPDRRRRHGRGLAGSGHQARPRRRHQGPSRRHDPRPRADRTLEREAKLLASLNHGNIAVIHGFDNADDTHYLVMEFVEGETLSARLERGPIPVEGALPVARQIAEALEAAHDSGVIHRDLKPGNVMIRPDRSVKVLDFGLARARGPRHREFRTRSPTRSPPSTRLPEAFWAPRPT